MPQPKIQHSWVLLTALLIGSPSHAAEPQISFAVKNRWVKFTLTHDDQPVTNGMVRVLDGGGNSFAEGETGDNGQGEFPLPPGRLFRVEIKIGNRTADLIPITSIAGNRVIPDRVLLSFGLAPCCRMVSRGVLEGPRTPVSSLPEPAQEKEILSPVWLPATGAVFLLLGGTTLVVVALRHSTSTANTLTKDLS